MSPFWTMTGRLIRRHRVAMVAALMFAFLSAGGLGAGLAGMAPIFRILLDPEDRVSLAVLATEYNEGEPYLAIPAPVIERLPDGPFEGVMFMIGLLSVLAVFGAAANFMHLYLGQTMSARAVAEIREEAFDRVLHLPLGVVVSRGPSEFVTRIVRDALLLQAGFTALVSKALAQITKGIAAFGAALWFDWRLTLLAVLVAPPLAITLRKLGKRIRRGTRSSLDAQDVLLRISTESFQGLRAVKAATAEAQVLERFRHYNARAVRYELKVRTARALSTPLVELLTVFALALLALMAARSIVSGRISPDTLILTLGALGIAGGAFKPLTGLINSMQAAAAPAERILELLSQPLEDADTGRPDLPLHAESIVFERVGFRYPSADRPALQEIDLSIRCGEHVAIVGPNGCGKTTLVSLVPALLIPETGCVRIDGRDVHSVGLQSLRRQIAVVTQDTVLFRGSVAENIALGNMGVSQEQICAAARSAHAEEFILRLPGGYDADLAEQGASLSGGQRQRLAIARAILRDPTILILDEATSQIDSESEARIAAAIREHFAGRTVLVIAHRLATVVDADRIVVMNEGRIEAIGPHAELLERSPLYRRLVHTQFLAAS